MRAAKQLDGIALMNAELDAAIDASRGQI